jgi:hypothetical protein
VSDDVRDQANKAIDKERPSIGVAAKQGVEQIAVIR